MRLLFVVQRYGAEVAGGAELHCRQFATRLADRGHDVDALSSCAVSYVTWDNEYPEGDTELDGVKVTRLRVAQRRDARFFGPLDARVVWGRKPVPLYLQKEWMRMQGPWLPDLAPWLQIHAADYDVVIFFTYLYYTTWAGLPVAAGLVPTVLHPTAHDEPPLALSLFDTVFRQPKAFAFSTDEERALVQRRFGLRAPNGSIGIGFDLDPGDAAADEARFRAWYNLGDDPYLLFVGRLDPGKGSDELFDFFRAFKERNPGALKLVVVGDPLKPLPPHPDVVVTGFVDEATKDASYAGATALVQPSYFESFSMVLAEAWVHSRPALVQGHCDVLVGQCRRSNGGIPYRGFAEFETAVQLLLDQPALGRELGRRGRAYVESRYSWDAVLGRYERLLRHVADYPRMLRPTRPLRNEKDSWSG
ncbi:MAG TPA: glycosyltransferase family 4 protein [Acidimicrobiales bacterium]|nr:glycosyltransferase family 4 protein [Acidimicrobiales bacterium]